MLALELLWGVGLLLFLGALALDRQLRALGSPALVACVAVLSAAMTIAAPTIEARGAKVPAITASVVPVVIVLLVVVYAAYGVSQARLALGASVMTQVVFLGLQVAFDAIGRQGERLPHELPGAEVEGATLSMSLLASLRLVSVVTFVIDFVVATVAFQALVRRRSVPVGVAAAAATGLGALVDAVLFPLLLHRSLERSWSGGHLLALLPPSVLLGVAAGGYLLRSLRPQAVAELRGRSPLALFVLNRPSMAALRVAGTAAEMLPLIVLDARTEAVAYISRGARVLLGLPANGGPRRVAELGPESIAAWVQAATGTEPRELWVRGPDGPTRVRVNGAILRVGARELLGAALTPADSRPAGGRRLDQERLRALAMAGFVASAVAHDIANLVQVLGPLARMAAEGARVDGAPAEEALADVTARIFALTRRMRDLTRPAEARLERVDLLAFARRVLGVFLDKLPNGASLRIEGEGELVALVEPIDLDRVLVNLVLNAAHASTGPVAEVLVRIEREPGGRVVLRVRDRGEGMADVDQMLLPFVSGREGGSGLGLSVVTEAVRSMGAELFIESEQGVGTEVRLVLQRDPGLAAGPVSTGKIRVDGARVPMTQSNGG